MTVATSRARRWTTLVLAAAAFAISHGWQLAPGGLALLVSFFMTTRGVRLRLLGAVVGAISIQILFRQYPYGFHGASSLLGTLAALPVLLSAHNRSSSTSRRRHRLIAGAFGGAALVATTAFGAALIVARQDLQAGASEARRALAAARKGDAVTAEQELSEADAALRRSAGLTGSWWASAGRAVPLVGHQAEAVSVITSEGRKVVRSAKVTAAVGDYDRLKYRTGRFDVGRLQQLQGPIANSAATLAGADRRIAKLDRGWLLAPLRGRINDFAHEISRATPAARLASSVVDTAPGLLGAHGTRHYFVAFITPAELRGAGGFIGNYGELTAQDGKVRLTRSGPIEELIGAAPKGRRRLHGPKDYLRRYGAFAPADYFQDLTFSPHFPFDADAIEQLYPQSGGQRVDGVISIDPFGLAALLRFTGPIIVPGLDTPMTTTNAADILLRQQYIRFGDTRTRKDLLVEASRITFEKLTTGDLPAPRELARVLGPMASQRRIMLHSVRPAEERLFTRVHADGALPSASGRDVLSIATQNAGNNKIDTFLHRTVAYDATVDPSGGGVNATATVAIRNDAPPSGLPDIVIGNSANVATGTNLMSISVYSSLRLVDATLDGRALTMQSDREAGLRVYSVRLRIASRSSTLLRLHLAGGLDLRTGYHLVATPQPVANADRITVSVHAAPGWRLTTGTRMRLEANGATSGSQEMTGQMSFRTGLLRR